MHLSKSINRMTQRVNHDVKTTKLIKQKQCLMMMLRGKEFHTNDKNTESPFLFLKRTYLRG